MSVDITTNVGFQNIIKTHRFITAPYANQEELLDNVEFYSSMLIFLNAIGHPISKEHLTIIGADKKIPDLDLKWYEILLKCKEQANVEVENVESMHPVEKAQGQQPLENSNPNEAEVKQGSVKKGNNKKIWM